jgi:hypothetical protein
MRSFGFFYKTFGIGLLVGVMFLPALVSAQSGPLGVQSADIQAEITSAGELQVKESIRYNFGGRQQTGFTRRLQIPDGGGIEIEAVSRDDLPENYRSTRAGDTLRITTGNQEIPLTGIHSYQFTYTIDGAVKRADDDPYVVWQVISGSNIAAQDITISLTAPFEISQAFCRVQEIDLGCPVDRIEQGVQAELSELPANRSVVFSVQLPSDGLPQEAINEVGENIWLYLAFIISMIALSGISYVAYRYLDTWVTSDSSDDDPTPERIDTLTS